MKKTFVLFTMLACIALAAAGTVKPDFAYPKTVEKNARAALETALKDNDEQGALRALINLTISSDLVDVANAPAAIEEISSFRDRKGTSASAKALADLLLAEMYSDIYNEKPYLYNRRAASPSPGDDFTLWSASRFSEVVNQLIDSALAQADELKTKPIGDYKDIITVDLLTRVYFPTLYDFVATRAIELIGNMNSRMTSGAPGYLPLSLLRPWPQCEDVNLQYLQPQAAKVLQIYASLLRFHQADAAPFVNTEIDRLKYVADCIIRSGNNCDEAQAMTEESLKQLFNSRRDSEYSGEALIAMYNLGRLKDEEKVWLFDHCSDNLSKFTTFSRRNELANILSNLRRKSVEIEYPKIAVPDSEIQVTVKSRNVERFMVNLYKVSAEPTATEIKHREIGATKPVASLEVDLLGKVPFATDTIVRLRVPEIGKYVVTADYDGATHLSPQYELSILTATRLWIGYTRADSTMIVVLDPVSGQPVEGAHVTGYSNRGNARKLDATTDRNGMVCAPQGESLAYVASKESDTSAPGYIYSNYRNNYGSGQEVTVNIFSSLAIYKPGDTVEWALVASTFNGSTNSVCAGKQLTVTFRDANYQTVDTVTVTTDAYGRAQGKFLIPRGLLTGNYTIIASSGNVRGDHSVMVSDYKLPTFEIKDLKAIVDLPSKGDVTLRGNVSTYSGFPLADARVSLSLSASRGFRGWFFSNPLTFYSTDTIVCDSRGNFETVLPAGLLKMSPFPDGLFHAAFTAVSASGEAQQAEIAFSAAKTHNLLANIPPALDVSHPVTLDVKEVDNEGAEIPSTVSYEIKGAVGAVKKGSFATSSPTVDWKSVPAGTYTISFSTPSGASETVENVCIYRPSDKYSPSTALLWTPSSKIRCQGREASFPLGTTALSTAVLVGVSDGRGNTSQYWTTLKRGMRTFSVTLPGDTTACKVTLSTVNDLRSEQITVNVTPTPAVKGIKVAIETMRDRMTPGTPETWRFRVSNLDGTPVEAAVIADLYNKALDRLCVNDLYLYLPEPVLTWYSANLGGADQTRRFTLYSPVPKTKKAPSIIPPCFETWGFTLYPSGYRNKMVYRQNMAMAAPTVAGAMTDGGVMETEEMVVMDTVEVGMDAGTVTESESTEESRKEEQYRPSEVPLGFFKPMLLTDSDGNLDISFTVPNANSTWQLNLLAYTASGMLSNTLTAQAVTSKPLMVSANLPRFLRTGDDAVIQAMVMNNSDTDISATSTFEIFNPATKETIATATFANALAPRCAATISINTGAIGELSMIGCRVRSTAGDFSDGEEAVIPVLSTISPVIDTATFYTAPSQKTAEVKIPSGGNDARYTLQYIENPLWTVITALPGLRERAPSTSVSAAASLYSACVATHIMKSRPDIAGALRTWMANPGDSMLTSLLSRNAHLKTLLLQATPWVVDAMTDTERMQRLALLFDRNETEAAVNAAVDVLAKTVCADGGWTWAVSSDSRDEASEWATMRVLSLLGMLNEDGALPADNRRLTSMISAALKYIDNTVARDYAKYPSGDYRGYTLMRLLFPGEKQSSAAKRVSDATVQQIIADWKGYDSLTKGNCAIILEKSGYHSTATRLLESLREYAITSPTAGTTWRQPGENYGSVYSTAAILAAFHTVEPGCSDIDPIRQWLILQKEALDWGDSWATTAAVNAVLTTSKRWERPRYGSRLYLDGNEFTPESAPELYTGYLRTALPTDAGGTTLKLAKGGDTAAYGAVYAQYRREMSEIVPRSTADVAIEKRCYLVAPDGLKEIERLAVGDRVRVELVITTKRDMDYVAITDERAACFEPVEQLPTPLWSEGVCFYRENLDAETRMFISRLPRGSYRLSYELFVNNAGTFTSGIATIQSQMAPQMTAHSGGNLLKVNPQ